MHCKTNELCHYGVLGMRWGVHKARTYAHDVNKYRYKQNIRRLNSKMSKALRDGEGKTMSRSQYERAKKKYKTELKRANDKIDREIGKTKIQKDSKVSAIYRKYKDQAVKEIPHYKLKRGLKTTGKVLGYIGLATAGNIAAYSLYGRANPAYAPTNFKLGNATIKVTAKDFRTAGDLVAKTTNKVLPTATVLGIAGKTEYDYRKTKKKK